MIPGCLHT